MAQQKPAQPDTLPPLETVVQNMINAGESEENIASVIQHYHGGGNSVPPTMLKGEPTDFWGGFRKSITSGEAFGDAGTKGALGWLKGATVDLPGSIMGGLRSVGNAIMHPADTLSNLPSDISNMASNAWETTKQAGMNPGAFGEMMGQVGGQPLVTAGITKGAPMLRNPIGRGIQAIGDTMEKYAPISGAVPKVIEPRIARVIERKVGGKIGEFGSKIQKPKVIQGEIVPPNEPAFTDVHATEFNPNEPPALNKPDSTILPNNTTETRQYRMLEDKKPLGLPPTDTSFYGQSPIQDNPAKMLPKFGGSTVNPLITKSMEAPIHPLDELVNSLNLDPGALTSLDENNNIISNFQKRQVPDTLQKPPESPVAGPVSGVPPTSGNEIDDLIAQLGVKDGHLPPTPEPPIEANPTEITTNKSKLKSADTIVHTGPDEFKDMNVWHNIGRNRYKPEFANDLDKIKFLAGQSVPTKNLPKFLKYIMDNTGLKESEALSKAKEFRLHAKEFMDGKKPGVIKIPTIGGN